MFGWATVEQRFTIRSKSAYRLPLLLLLALGFDAAATAITVRSLDGSGNNLANPLLGATNTPLTRILSTAYEDGTSTPRGGDPSSLPGARAVSNAVSSQTTSTPSAAGINSWFWQWGQFIDHDISLTGTAHEAFNIPVPGDDHYFQQNGSINLERSIFEQDVNGVRQQLNQISTYIDGSMIYGSDASRAAYLRANDGTGKLKTTVSNGEILLPYNTAMTGLANAMAAPHDDPGDYFIAGDVRANEQLGLTAVHTLFVREHNRLAEDLATRLNSTDGDFIYEAARKIVGAQIQKITYNEFLPLLLGNEALEDYTAYDDMVDPAISNAFSTAAFRVGHTMLPSSLYRANSTNPADALTPIELRDAFFNPAQIASNGVDSLLMGLLHQPAQELDTLIIDDVRNFLFGPPGGNGFDLASLNIQRGRDHGLPGYNQARRDIFGLDPVMSFLGMTGGDQLLADAFAAVYSSVEEVDLWSGGLAELHHNGGLVGETFHYIIQDQFQRLRDADRFFFMNPEEMAELLLIDPMFMTDTSLSNIIERNTGYSGMPVNAFLMANVPTPGSQLLILIGLFSLLASNSLNRSITKCSNFRPRHALKRALSLPAL